MESPFYKNNSQSIVLYLEPYLNTYYKNYQNIITLSNMPVGPLADMVTTISFPKLSAFQNASPFFSNPNNCTFVLLRYPKNSGYNLKTTDCFMGADDIPAVLSYLRSNGYTIEIDLTKMLFKSRVLIGGVSDSKMSGDRKMICSFLRETLVP